MLEASFFMSMFIHMADATRLMQSSLATTICTAATSRIFLRFHNVHRDFARLLRISHPILKSPSGAALAETNPDIQQDNNRCNDCCGGTTNQMRSTL
jgi:hypothetical protein